MLAGPEPRRHAGQSPHGRRPAPAAPPPPGAGRPPRPGRLRRLRERDPPLHLLRQARLPILKNTLLATTSLSRLPLIAFPSMVSATPYWYMFAVSKKLIPASRQRLTICVEPA